MFFSKKKEPPPVPYTKADVEAVQKAYSEKYYFFESMTELLPEEREFLKETARAALVIEASKYAKS